MVTSGNGDCIATWRLEGETLGAPATLLVHGWEDDNSLWTPIVRALQGAGKAVIGLDLPGHGYSQGETCTVASTAQALVDVIAAQGPVDSIITHSFGGVGLAAALMRGVKIEAAVLISPPTYQSQQYERAWRRHGVEEAVIAQALALGDAQSAFFDMEEVARNFEPSALFVHSRDDEQCPCDDARKAAAAWKNAQFWEVDGLGHRALVKDDDVVSVIAAWLLAKT
jgi:pimeloyl-ACP methyl ester carboxylesterase